MEHEVPDTLRELIVSENDVQITYFHVKLIEMYARNIKLEAPPKGLEVGVRSTLLQIHIILSIRMVFELPF